jgi:hypothetical protein
MSDGHAPGSVSMSAVEKDPNAGRVMLEKEAKLASARERAETRVKVCPSRVCMPVLCIRMSVERHLRPSRRRNSCGWRFG